MSLPVVVLERWSGKQLSLKQPWTGVREFSVDNVANADEALVAVDAVSGLKIPQKGEVHNRVSALFCDGPEIKEPQGPFSWIIACGYSTVSIGGDPTDTEIDWETCEMNVPIDSDLDHRAILNSDGFPISGLSRRITFKRLKLTKKFPYFDSNWCKTYENSTNSNDIMFADGTPIAAQHMRVCSICPTVTTTIHTLLRPVQWVFDVFLDDSLGQYPFQHRVLDASEVGWYLDTDVGKVVPARYSDTKGNLFGLQVRLDGTGLPLPGAFADIKVGKDNRAPRNPPKATNYYAIERFGNDGTITPLANNSTQAVFLYFKQARVIDHSPLLSLL